MRVDVCCCCECLMSLNAGVTCGFAGVPYQEGPAIITLCCEEEPSKEEAGSIGTARVHKVQVGML